jgi:hypothetical protein
VEPPSPEQLSLVIEPLADAGLEPEQIRDLLFRLAFEAIVSEDGMPVPCLTDVVRDQPPAVQAAWLRVVGRMIALGGSGPPGS